MRGLHLRKPGKTLSHTDMNTKIDELFAALRILISVRVRAIAMAEIASVAAERDKLKLTESFAIAGLVNNEVRQAVAKIPVLGDIPILGALFGCQHECTFKFGWGRADKII